MKLVKIDEFEEHGGEFAVKDGDFMVLLTGPSAGKSIDGNMGVLPNYEVSEKDLREAFGEDSMI